MDRKQFLRFLAGGPLLGLTAIGAALSARPKPPITFQNLQVLTSEELNAVFTDIYKRLP